eukprot:Nitzschia sp. Nitz4//scaffold148_size54725//31499//32074//NITZ4_006660-RA/size54725-processed-gene-0.23-mRNA-1//-1//CDS//3329536754//4144//frame0
MSSSSPLPTYATSSSNNNDHTAATTPTKETSKSSLNKCCCCVSELLLDWVVFPLLLFVQYGFSWHCQQSDQHLNNNTTLFPSAWLTALCVASFCLTSVGYRHVIKTHPVWNTHLVLLLLPEAFTNILLAVALWVSLGQALMVLTGFTLLLALMGMGVAWHAQSWAISTGEDVYQLLEEESLQEEDQLASVY